MAMVRRHRVRWVAVSGDAIAGDAAGGLWPNQRPSDQWRGCGPAGVTNGVRDEWNPDTNSYPAALHVPQTMAARARWRRFASVNRELHLLAIIAADRILMRHYV